MIDLEYFKAINYGDLLFHGLPILPLIGWIYFCKTIVYPWLRASRITGLVFTLIIFSISLPFIVLGYNIFSAEGDLDLQTASLIPGWGFCLNTKKISEEEIQKGVVGYWDYKCGSQQESMNTVIVEDLINRFYYLSNALFIFVLVIYNNISVNILRNQHIIKSTVFCLIMGIIGMSLVVYNTYYLKTLAWNHVMTTILVMNISAFFILIIGILQRLLR